MNGVNILFVLSCIFVPLLLISINYSTIHNFYEYSIPLNSLELERSLEKNEQKEGFFYGPTFDEILEKDGSQCFSTSMNYFCYNKLSFTNNMEGISIVASKTNGIVGEMHFFPTEERRSLFVIQNMTQIKEDTVLIHFSNSKYFRNNSWTPPMSSGGITEEFEYSAIIEKFDTFISHCRNPEGTRVTLIQYLGIQSINDIDYFVTWHTSAISESGITCVYPQIIKHSIGYDFGI